jgi:hypothetical protein
LPAITDGLAIALCLVPAADKRAAAGADSEQQMPAKNVLSAEPIRVGRDPLRAELRTAQSSFAAIDSISETS